ncbi:MAG: SDR family NAD(P)-dependent oxidoreductase [Actinomycetia bacterium]|nr:SDR family NAD(P)-dependent oxidoreductase [Actinomycetes bacterium]
MRLEGGGAGRSRVAVVTGASSGIGAALARKLSAGGWHCVLLARRRDRLEAVAREVGGEAEICDVAEREEVAATAQRVAEQHPSIRLLVNNAGIPGCGEFLTVPPERIEQIIRINYLGTVWCTREFLPLLEADAPADIANVVSVAGTVAGGAGGPYAAAKHAQIAFSRASALELEPRGIRVHTVNPGFAHTEGFPQDRILNHPWARHLVLTEAEVADAVLKAVAQNRREVFVPGFYRLPAALQGAMPATFSHVLGWWNRRVEEPQDSEDKGKP